MTVVEKLDDIDGALTLAGEPEALPRPHRCNPYLSNLRKKESSRIAIMSLEAFSTFFSGRRFTDTLQSILDIPEGHVQFTPQVTDYIPQFLHDTALAPLRRDTKGGG